MRPVASNRVSNRDGRPPTRRIPRGWAVLVLGFLAYTAFRLVEMTWWLIRAVTH